MMIYISDNRKRHLFYWNHTSSFLENWRLNVDYTKVSDKRYFTDFDSDYGTVLMVMRINMPYCVL